MVEVMMSKPVESSTRTWMPSGMGWPWESLPSICRLGSTLIRMGSEVSAILAGTLFTSVATWLLQVVYAVRFAPAPAFACATKAKAPLGANAMALPAPVSGNGPFRACAGE